MKNRIVVFALGWACDHNAAANQTAALGDVDVLWLYDWRQMPSASRRGELRERVAAYPERYLVAWSFGVWAAETIFGGVDFTRAVAVNGTPLPADERYGIGLKRLQLTLRGLPSRGMGEFLRRSCGNSGDCGERLDPRGVEANAEELRSLIAHSAKPCTPSIAWDAAVVGTGDAIFPPENMLAYWGNLAKTLPLPHYPFEEAALTASLLKL